MIDRNTFKRIEAATKAYERRLRVQGPRLRGPRAQSLGRWFRTTSSFAAASDDGTTLTMPTGSASPLDTTLGVGSDTAKASGEPDLTLANGLNATIASGTVAHAVSTGGRFIIDLVWC